MNVAFVTLYKINSINEHNIYSDLMREFIKNGDSVSILCATNIKKNLVVEESESYRIIHVSTGKIVKTNPIKKGINTLLIDSRIVSASKKFLKDRIDLLIYCTPPITLVKTIKYLKKKNGCKTYLLLKDIFPQNAIDLGMLTKKGIKGFIYRHFRKKEKKLYELSDFIGCMSEANVSYIKANNKFSSNKCIEVNPNSLDISRYTSFVPEDKVAIRKKYNLPLNKKIFVYGGNLGKPQNIPFVIECIRKSSEISEVHFAIVGSGTEYKKLEEYCVKNPDANLSLLQSLPNDEYLQLIAACDVGLIFLDNRFTIPNYPSRLLDYMLVGIPVLACTDKNTDIGKTILEGGFGWWSQSSSSEEFAKKIKEISKNDYKKIKEIEIDYLKKHFNVCDSYNIIKSHLN